LQSVQENLKLTSGTMRKKQKRMPAWEREQILKALDEIRNMPVEELEKIFPLVRKKTVKRRRRKTS